MSGRRSRPKLGETYLIIPDVQTRADVPNKHLNWIGEYIIDRRPDRVICLGDFADVTSLASFNRGRIEAEGRRYIDDVKATKASMGKLMAPLQRYNRTHRKKYTPSLDMCLGNHEDRCDRVGKEAPHLMGAISSRDLGYEEFGWVTHPFLKVIRRGGVQFSHFFTSGAKGMPVTSAAALLRVRQGSAIMGHVQSWDCAVHQKSQAMGIFAGVAALHDEDYLGFQGNDYRRQILMLHEVHDNGLFDLMQVSLKWLEAKYSK